MSRPSYKLPESVLVVVATRNGLVLMLERREPAGFWQSVTGSLEAGETPMQAARRELAEETGIHDVGINDCRQVNEYPILPAWRHRYAPGVRYNTEHVFSVMLAHPVEVRLNPGEHVSHAWLPCRQAAERAFSHTNRDAILACAPDVTGRQQTHDPTTFAIS